jgi:glycerophosphoryl diester phosphodiesterase
MLIVGHRGARHEAPENTLPGFRHAIGLGLQIVEFDVRMSADDELVIIHDDSVDRTTTSTGKVADMTLAELQSLDARAAFPDWPEPCAIPTLIEALEVCRAFPIILVEIKKDVPERIDVIVPKTIAEIRQLGLENQARIISFDTHALEIAQRDAPEIKRHLIGDWNAEHFLDDAIRLEVVQIEAHHPTADRALVRRAREAGFSIGAWQTNTEEDLRSVLEMEPDVFSSDCPTYIRTLVGDRETTTVAS